ncbi:MAG: hypothetical protein ACEQSK_09025 [Sphingomonadaceae bacterium]
MLSLLVCAVALSACATPPALPPAPPSLSDSPDLSAYRTLEIQSNANAKRQVLAARFVAAGAYLELEPAPNGASQRLYIQVEQCANDADPQCPRRYMLNGDIQALASPLKCYIQIRNDVNSGYLGQALQGLCQDSYHRSYSATISK